MKFDMKVYLEKRQPMEFDKSNQRKKVKLGMPTERLWICLYAGGNQNVSVHNRISTRMNSNMGTMTNIY